MRANETDFDRHALRQRVLVEARERDPSATFLGRTHALPLALGPVGFTGLFWRSGEFAAAERAGIAFSLSNFAIATVGEVRAREAKRLRAEARPPGLRGRLRHDRRPRGAGALRHPRRPHPGLRPRGDGGLGPPPRSRCDRQHGRARLRGRRRDPDPGGDPPRADRHRPERPRRERGSTVSGAVDLAAARRSQERGGTPRAGTAPSKAVPIG